MSIAYLTARAVVLEAEYIEDLLDGPVEPGRDDVDHDHFLTGRDYGRAVRDCIDAWRAEGLDYTRASYCAIALIDLARTRHQDHHDQGAVRHVVDGDRRHAPT